jgi:catechol 2,3-dioxygenase-like lactoylglutathione lyase family enzyme
MNISHVGLRVRDLDKSKRFYEALGFTEAKRLTVPDAVAGGLLGLTPPIGFEAVYLQNDGFILQLLTFSGYPAPDEAERTMVVAGLTHLSIAVDDIAEAQATVRSAGGTVIADPGGGFACMVRDPEGQLVELIHSSVRPIPPT